MGTDSGTWPGSQGSGDRDRGGVHVTGSSGVQVGSGNVQYNVFGAPAPASHSGAAPAARSWVPDDSADGGHAFISYVREDGAEVDRLQRALEDGGVPVWRDSANLWPGESWKDKIRAAIGRDALVFIACFSSRSVARSKSYMYEELWLAIDQLRSRRPDVPWLIPVRFDDCDIPDFDIGAGRTLTSMQQADLFGPDRDRQTSRLVTSVQRLLR